MIEDFAIAWRLRLGQTPDAGDDGPIEIGIRIAVDFDHDPDFEADTSGCRLSAWPDEPSAGEAPGRDRVSQPAM